MSERRNNHKLDMQVTLLSKGRSYSLIKHTRLSFDVNRNYTKGLGFDSFIDDKIETLSDFTKDNKLDFEIVLTKAF